MATRERFEEAIRLYVETAGDDELKKLVASFGDLGDVADFQAGMARKAMQRLADTVDSIANVEAFEKLKRDLIATESQLKQAQAGAQALFAEFKAGDTSNGRVSALQKQASNAVNQLSESAAKQRLELQRLRGELAASGVDTRQLGSAQGQLRAQMASAKEALVNAAKSVSEFRAENAKAAKAVPEQNERIARSYDLVEKGLKKLRSVGLVVGAYLGLDRAVDGIKRLAEVGAASESARRSLGNLYKGQEEGNRAFAALKTIAAENGLAFQDVVDQAKKLKAFGLDPLNGSLQALIDQNSAVGGSQQDLEGKVLALGQAWAKQKLQGEEILQLVERGVPVWELLQRATGKSVTELQKLSEQGKLGRDVIRDLYEEIGKANAGAANAGLTSLSGLIAQVNARWQEFLGKIVDSGVGDYFKRQLQSLLAGTQNLDALARRIAAGVVSSLEAVRGLAQQLAPLVSGVVSGTLALARHADALVIVAKAYAAVRVAGFYQDIARGAIAMRAANAATLATTAQTTGAVAGFSRLGAAVTDVTGKLGGLVGALKIGALGAAIDFTVGQALDLVDAIEQYGDMLDRVSGYERAQTMLQQDRLRLGQELQALYRSSAGTVVQSGQQISAMTRAQAEDYQFALEQARQYFGGVIREARASKDAQAEATATARWKELGGAIESVKERVAALDREASAAAGLRKFVDTAVAKFDDLASKSKSAAQAVNGVFSGLDFGSDKGVQQAIDILDQINTRGVAASEAIKTELRETLLGIASRDLPALKAAADDAFGGGSAAAKQFAAEVDRISFSRLGVDVEAIRTGFTKAGRTAVDSFKGAVDEVDKLGLTAAQRSTAIAQAFDNAFKQASTKKELAALKTALQSALSAGDLGFKEFKDRIAETDAKLAELAGTGANLGKSVAQGASQASGALSQVADSASAAADGAEKAGDSSQGAAAKMEDASKEGQQFALSLYEVSQAGLEATIATNRFAGMIQWADRLNEVTARINAQGDALHRQVAELQKANAEFDELAQRRAELAGQYNLLGAGEIEKVLQAEQQLEQSRQRAAEKRRAADEQAARAAAEAASGADTTPEQIQVARRQAGETAQIATDLLSQAQQTARTLADAATTVRTAAAGEIVIRIVSDAPGNGRLNFTSAQMDDLAARVVRALRDSKRSSI